jgi:hypothetical protein
MKTSVETINGKAYTIIWYGNNPIKNTLGRRFAKLSGGVFAIFRDADCLDHIATALPALRRYPKPEDAKWLYQYMAEGIEVFVRVQGFISITSMTDSEGMLSALGCEACEREITHATYNGKRVEIAIEEGQV